MKTPRWLLLSLAAIAFSLSGCAVYPDRYDGGPYYYGGPYIGYQSYYYGGYRHYHRYNYRYDYYDHHRRPHHRYHRDDDRHR